MTAIGSQILQNRLVAMCHEGADTFRRMARSTLVIGEGQYACAILDANARLLAQHQGEPSQLAAVRDTARYIIDHFSFDIAEGDVLLAGDPYCGGTSGGHLTVMKPVAVNGDIAYFAAIRFAAADLAGNIPGLLQPDAHEIWQESLRLTPIKLDRDGSPRKDVMRYILRNTRAPQHLRADLDAATAATLKLSENIAAIIASHGAEPLAMAAEYGITYAQARALKHLETKISSNGQGRATLLEDGIGELTVVTNIIRNDETFVIDFTGSSSTHDRAANLTPAATRAAVIVELFADLLDEVPVNEGILGVLEIKAPENTCLNPAYPAAVSMGWRLVAPLISRAIAEAAGADAPVLSSATPSLVAFECIGSVVQNIPVQISPAYRPAQGLAGGTPLDGMRIAPSAEEAEKTGIYRIISREFGDTGEINSKVVILRADLEGIVPPTGSNDRPLITQSHPLEQERNNVLKLEAGAEVSFTYHPRQMGETHALR